MENKEELFAIVRKLRIDCAVRQKKGLHFIVSSVIVWLGIIVIHASSLPMESKNMYMCILRRPTAAGAVTNGS